MKQDWQSKSLIFAFLCFGIFPLLPVKLIGLPVILFLIACILNFAKSPPKKLSYTYLVLALIPYIFFLVSILYSEDKVGAIKKIFEPRLSLLVIPISFFLLGSNVSQLINLSLTKLILLFSISAGAMSLIYLGYLPFVEKPLNPYFAFPSGFFFRSAAVKMPFWELEPVYFSFVLVIATLFINKLYYNKKLKLSLFLPLAALYFLVLLLMSSKIALGFIVIFTISQVLFMLKVLKFKIAFLMLIFLAFYPLSHLPSIKYEIEEIQYFLKGEKRAKNDASDIRYRITVSSLELAKNTNILIGNGVGDVQKKLNEIYLRKEYDDLLLTKHDAHNQYMSMFLGTGLLGLLGLIIHLIIVIKVSLQKRLKTFSWIICFITLQMLTETALERQIPVILYALFISIILFLSPDVITKKVGQT